MGSATKSKSFTATLESTGPGLRWVIIRVPFDVKKIWGARGQFKVKGEINGFGFRTSLFPSRKGDHIMIVNKRMRMATATAAGRAAKFRLEPDTASRTVSTPAELKRIMKGEPEMERWYNGQNYSMRKYFADLITGVKSPEARVRRAEQIAETVMSAMEAEQELPPLLRREFARVPHALEGWERMSPRQRRGNLLAIFYYRSPDARLRRIAKVAGLAAEYADR